MNHNHSRKLILLSLLSTLFATLFLLIGLSFKESPITISIQGFLAELLYFSSFMALFNNYKKEKYAIYVWLMIVIVFFIVFTLMILFSIL